MQVELIFKVAAIGLIVAILNQLLIKSGRDDQAMLTSLAGLIVAIMILIDELNNMFNLLKNTLGF